MDFVYNRDAENTAHLRSVTPNTETTVRLYNIKTDAGALAQIIARGAKDVTVNNQRSIDAARSIINTAVQHHGTTVLGDLNQIFIGTLNVYNNNVFDPDAGRRDDKMITGLVIEHNSEFLKRVKFSPDLKTINCNGLFLCDPVTNVWSQQPNPVMEEHVMQCVDELADDVLNDRELKHVRSHRGRKELLYLVACKLTDQQFPSRLDSSVDIFALRDDVVVAKLGPALARTSTTPEHLVMTTTGWAYDPEEALKHRADVDRFFETLMPVPEERAVLLSYFASCLTGSRASKKILALTDRRQGNNGKSSLLCLMRVFFGDFYSCNTKFVCAASFQSDRNSHDAGLEVFKGKRLVAAEELKNSMTLDVALLKMLSGGTGVVVEGRKFGQGDRFKFTWQANIVLVFNEGDCPAFDSGDSAFMQRLLVAPMRSKFVAAMPEEPEEHTYLMDPDINYKFLLWRSALLDLLLEGFEGARHRIENPPESMLLWRQGIATDANPLADWMQKTLVITGDRDDYVLLKDVVKAYEEDAGVPRQSRIAPVEAKRLAKAYLQQVALGYKELDNLRNASGGWTRCRQVARGVRYTSVP
jgi:phage/plasmid-associated DNA primase